MIEQVYKCSENFHPKPGGIYKDLARDVVHDDARRQGQHIGNDPAQHTDHHSFENEDPLYSTPGRTDRLHDPDPADALHHIDPHGRHSTQPADDDDLI